MRKGAAVTNVSGHLRESSHERELRSVENMALNLHCSTCKLRASDVNVSSKEI